ncbi:hypothetical protein [Plantactinospora sonchi]|uniref:Uncharacterized protein n=1 Tax=Plantactinospora sonchi TaxID=1544735 RepID=A0ABU7RPJ7_9ACTN
MADVAISEVDGWPRGEDLKDLTEYALAQGAEGYDVHEVRLCGCAECGGSVFGIHGDLENQAAKRVCRGCGSEHFIADSGEYWDDTRFGIMVCECDGDGDEEDFNVAVGYSLYADRGGIRAIAITSRCVACGRLGYWDDWMIRSDELRLLDLA